MYVIFFKKIKEDSYCILIIYICKIYINIYQQSDIS